MNYENKKEVHLMVWEENPNKRNSNNEIKFNIPKESIIEVVDKIRSKIGNGKYSCYEITEIKEVRPSSISTMNYVTALTKWYAE